MTSSSPPPEFATSVPARPASVDELAAIIGLAATEQKLLVPGRTLPAAPNRACQLLCLRKLDGVVDYPARDMTITVQAGMTFGQLDRLLQAENQQLPIDVGDHEQTIGAVVADDVSGPRRYGYGTLRDYLIGIEAVDGTGRVFHAGGRVVKNVAGYDLCRLLIGSRGTLAVLTQLTFKLKPRVPAEQLLLAGFRNLHQLDAALERLNRSAARPVMLEVLNRSAAAVLLSPLDVPGNPVEGSDKAIDFADCTAFVAVSVEGTKAACDWQTSVLQNELQSTLHWQRLFAAAELERAADGAAAVYRRTVLQYQSSLSDARWSGRLSTLPSRIVSTMTMLSATDFDIFGRAGNGVLFIRKSDTSVDRGNVSAEDNTAETTLNREPECLQLLRGVVADGTGSLSLLNTSHDGTPQISASTLELMKNLKGAFDPHQIFPSIF